MSASVNSPPHYTKGYIECVQAIEAALTADEFRGYLKGCAMKYMWRERHKGGDEDIEKAAWYLNRLIYTTTVAPDEREPRTNP